ncbi:MAG: hypothetical protein AAF360_14460 [Pseudomonadota bacterium]
MGFLAALTLAGCGGGAETVSPTPFVAPLAPGAVHIQHDDPAWRGEDRALAARLAAALERELTARRVFTAIAEDAADAAYILRIARLAVEASYAPERWLSDGDGVGRRLEVLIELDRMQRRGDARIPIVTFRVAGAATTPRFAARSDTLAANRRSALAAAIDAAASEAAEYLAEGN